MDDEILAMAEGEYGSAFIGVLGGGGDGVSRTGDEGEGSNSDEDQPGPSRLGPFSESGDLDPNPIIYPSGLRKDQVIQLISINDLSQLTEADVKAVQDEMWIKEKNGNVSSNKDGTLRKKPGPAKGWKKLREAEGRPVGESRRSIGGGSEVGSEFDDSIGDEDEHRSKKRRIDVLGGGGGGGEDGSRYDESEEDRPSQGMEEETDDEEEEEVEEIEGDHLPLGSTSHLNEPQTLQDNTSEKKKYTKSKEPGVGKGKWTRPSKPTKDDKKTSTEPTYEEYDSSWTSRGGGGYPPPTQIVVPFAPPPPNMQIHEQSTTLPNTIDPRGISEVESRIRLHLVEELQRIAWYNIVRDVPRVYRVNQAFDQAVKQNAVRTSGACIRNAVSQRALKPSYKSVARINKDAATKARRVVKEVSTCFLLDLSSSQRATP